MVILGGVFAACMGGCAWLTIRYFRPRHYFRALYPGGGESVFQIKNLRSSFSIKDPRDGKDVLFALDQAYARMGPKGSMRYTGDMQTGLLIYYDHHGPGWLELDGKQVAAMAEDVRETKLAGALSAGPYDKFLVYMPIILGIIALGMVIGGVVLYQIYQKMGH